MNEIMEAINLAFEKYRETYGEDAHLEDGEEFVTVFNNCVLIVSLEKWRFKNKVHRWKTV